MRITGFNSVRNSSSAKRTGKTGSTTPSSFEELLAAASSPGQTAAADAPSAVQSLNPMLALQEISDEEARRGALIKHGELSLEALEKLRQALLIGALSPEVLENLKTTLARQRTFAAADPVLDALLDDIELRVAVELAKIDVAKRNAGMV